MSEQPSIHPLTPDRWNDLENLFGKRGATGGCWCMFWRQTHKEFESMKGEVNRQLFKNLVDDDSQAPGLLAYRNGEPIGWIAIAPRIEYIRLEKSRILKPVDEQTVWSIVCFFISKKWRKSGVTSQLIKASLEFAKNHGAKIVEAYPVDTQRESTPDVFVYTGLASTFRNLGFKEVARRSSTRPIVRYYLEE